VAERIEHELGVVPNLIEGNRGEFTVLVGEQVVAKKGWVRFPSDATVLSAVRRALEE
jgi:hypothetical protein